MGDSPLDQGWYGSVVARQLKMRYFLAFNVLAKDNFKVIVFDLYGTEFMAKCS